MLADRVDPLHRVEEPWGKSVLDLVEGVLHPLVGDLVDRRPSAAEGVERSLGCGTDDGDRLCRDENPLIGEDVGQWLVTCAETVAYLARSFRELSITREPVDPLKSTPNASDVVGGRKNAERLELRSSLGILEADPQGLGYSKVGSQLRRLEPHQRFVRKQDRRIEDDPDDAGRRLHNKS